MEHSIESDVELLESVGYDIVSWAKTRRGHAILWFDKKGYTVAVRAPGSYSVGGALSFEAASAEYVQRIQELLQLGGKS